MSSIQGKQEELSYDAKTIITVLTLLLFFPVGSILMWIWMKWPVWVKLLLSFFLLISLLTFLLIIPLVALNPAESIMRARDAKRISDISTIGIAIGNLVNENANRINLCGTAKSPCVGKSNETGQNIQGVDGTGWIKVKLTGLEKLPIDPKNTSPYIYIYCSNGKDWEINSVLESKQNRDKMKTDGGDNPSVYETGNSLKLCP